MVLESSQLLTFPGKASGLGPQPCQLCGILVGERGGFLCQPGSWFPAWPGLIASPGSWPPATPDQPGTILFCFWWSLKPYLVSLLLAGFMMSPEGNVNNWALLQAFAERVFQAHLGFWSLSFRNFPFRVVVNAASLTPNLILYCWKCIRVACWG